MFKISWMNKNNLWSKYLSLNLRNNSNKNESYADVFQGRLKKNLIRISILAVIGQMLGINAVIFYST